MTKVVRGVLQEPTVLRLDEPVELPLHVPVDVTISEPAVDGGAVSTFLALAETLRVDRPSDLSERWEEYLAEDEGERAR